MKFSVLSNGITTIWTKEDKDDLLYYELKNYRVIKSGFTNLIETLNYITQLKEIELGAEVGHS